MNAIFSIHVSSCYYTWAYLALCPEGVIMAHFDISGEKVAHITTGEGCLN